MRVQYPKFAYGTYNKLNLIQNGVNILLEVSFLNSSRLLAFPWVPISLHFLHVSFYSNTKQTHSSTLCSEQAESILRFVWFFKLHNWRYFSHILVCDDTKMYRHSDEYPTVGFPCHIHLIWFFRVHIKHRHKTNFLRSSERLEHLYRAVGFQLTAWGLLLDHKAKLGNG